MAWPTPQDYNEAVQSPKTVFADRELQGAAPETTKLGLPKVITGNFASVYRFGGRGREWAVRCFHRRYADMRDRYSRISETLSRLRLPCMVPFEYLHRGIRIRGEWYPILKMEWVQGSLLTTHVQNNLAKPKALKALAKRWRKMCADLGRAGIAHGDLQHGNVIIVKDQPRLVDYDGMYVESLAGMRGNESGHPNYQHPHRTGAHFGPYIDNFSAWVIYVSLVALATDPTLLEQTTQGEEALLFKKKDFELPAQSRAFKLLSISVDPEVRKLASKLEEMARMPVALAPSLDGKPPATAGASPAPSSAAALASGSAGARAKAGPAAPRTPVPHAKPSPTPPAAPARAQSPAGGAQAPPAPAPSPAPAPPAKSRPHAAAAATVKAGPRPWYAQASGPGGGTQTARPASPGSPAPPPSAGAAPAPAPATPAATRPAQPSSPGRGIAGNAGAAARWLLKELARALWFLVRWSLKGLWWLARKLGAGARLFGRTFLWRVPRWSGRKVAASYRGLPPERRRRVQIGAAFVALALPVVGYLWHERVASAVGDLASRSLHALGEMAGEHELVEIDSSQTASLYVDGELVQAEVPPAYRATLPVGDHGLRFVRADGSTREIEIDVVKGRPERWFLIYAVGEATRREIEPVEGPGPAR